MRRRNAGGLIHEELQEPASHTGTINPAYDHEGRVGEQPQTQLNYSQPDQNYSSVKPIENNYSTIGTSNNW